MEVMETFLVFLALVIASITLFIQRQHNRKELLPILNTVYEQNNDGNKHLYQFWLVNNGHGTAIIKSINLNLPSGEVIELSNQYSFLHVIEEYVPDRTRMSNSLPISLSASSKEKLYSFEIPSNCSNGLIGSSVTVVAESVYGDCITVTNEGFNVTSNPKDAVFESALNVVIDAIIRLLPKRN